MQKRYDPYLQVDEGWDDSTEELVTEIFMLAGDASSTLLEMHYRIAILWSKVRPETFLKLVNAIPLPNTDLRVILQEATPRTGGRGNPETRKEAQGCEPSGHSTSKEKEGNIVS